MQALHQAIDAYEAANRDEHGPLRGAAFTAIYRAGQGMPISGIAPETEALNEEAAGWCRAMLAGLDAIQAAALDDQDRLSLDVLRHAVGRRLESTQHYWHVITVTPYRSFPSAFQMIFQAVAADGDEARTRYFAVLRDVGIYARAAKAKLEGQVKRGIVLPRRVLPAIVATHRAAMSIEKSPFLPKRSSVPDGTAEVLREHVVPAIAELVEYLEGPYSAVASEGWGQSALPDGAPHYRYCVRDNTTTELTPEQIHERGLRVVAELREAMASVRARIGFSGTAGEFHSRLRIDPRFVPQSPEQIREKLERFAQIGYDALDSFFARRQKAPFGAKRLPEDLEVGMTFGYYHPGANTGETGYYLFNGSKLSERSLLSLASLALHELVPGHHYEINVARENEALPRFRAFHAISTYIAAYHEGYAEYAADLGKEFGAYEDPYDLYGRHALDVFISSRLVVDTGMNALGWSYDKAAEFLRENTLMSETEIASELPRYATDLPAQALAYKLGSLTFAELREKARSALGSRFDVRTFHDRIVANGGMPLTMVASEVDRYIAAAPCPVSTDKS
ncbi:MAG TPA: DUF885 domain-containing protein [Candidatus Baltobacteraceae bacterium]|nr:DUF885 domain-containing protein [Candidatus Baltobacteraceae bacterium]